MRLRRGTTAAFLSLQNYVFRGPPPYLSKHNKFPLCLPFLHLLPPLHPPLLHRLFFRRSLPGSLQPGRVCPPPIPRSYISVSSSITRCRRIHPSLFVRASNVHTHTCRFTSFRGSIRVHRFPPTSSHPDRSQLPKSSIRGLSA